MKRLSVSVLSIGILCLGVSTATSGCKDITGAGACSQYKIDCGKVQNGVGVVGGIVPERCDCPSNTYFDSKDNITAGGPYNICVCR